MTSFGPNYLSQDLQQAVDSEVEQGEHILWTGQPTPARLARTALPMTFFGLFFGGFAVFWIWGAATGMSHHSVQSSGPGAFFPLFGLPFFLIGLGMVLSPLYLYNSGKRTVYAITEKRAIIISGGSKKTVQSYYGRDMSTVERTDLANGTGDVVFARKFTSNSNQNSTSTPVGFYGVANVREAETLIHKIRDGVES